MATISFEMLRKYLGEDEEERSITRSRLKEAMVKNYFDVKRDHSYKVLTGTFCVEMIKALKELAEAGVVLDDRFTDAEYLVWSMFRR